MSKPGDYMIGKVKEEMLAAQLMGIFFDIVRTLGKEDVLEAICTQIAIAEQVTELTFNEVYSALPKYRQMAYQLFTSGKTAQEALAMLQADANRQFFGIDVATGRTFGEGVKIDKGGK